MPPIDAGSISSEVRIKLDLLSADIAKAQAAYDNLGAEFAASADKYGTLAGKKYVNSLSLVSKEMKNVTGAMKAGAISEENALTRLIALRKNELSILQARAVKEGTASSESVAAIKKTEKALADLEEKERLLSSSGKTGGGLMQTFANLRDVMLGPVAVVKEVIRVFQTLKAKSDEMENAWAEQAEASSLLDAILKQTGADAWTTSGHLKEVAGSLQGMTKYGDESIESMQGVLLGFRNIQGANFDHATEAILDMATVMKMDLTNAAQTVGKALDNPIEGLDSLSRQGFKFTAQEKEMLKTLVDTGKLAEAQGIILKELDRTYGGAAKAVGELDVNLKTRLKNAIGDVNEEIGRSISSSLAPFRERWLKIAEAVGAAAKAQNDFDDALKKTEKGTSTAQDELTILRFKAQQLNEAMEKSTDVTGNAQRMYKELLDPIYAAIRAKEQEVYWNNEAAKANKKGDADKAAQALKNADEIKEREKALEDYKKDLASINTLIKIGSITESTAAEKRRDAREKEVLALSDITVKYKNGSADTGDILKQETKALQDENIAITTTMTAIEVMNKAKTDARNASAGSYKQYNDEGQAIDALTVSLTDQTKAIKLQELTQGQQLDAAKKKMLEQVDVYESAGHDVTELRAQVESYFAALRKPAATKEFQKNMETAIDAASSLLDSFTAIYVASMQKQMDALDEEYAHKKELIENDNKTKAQSLQDQLDDAIEKGDMEEQAAVQKQIDLLTLEENYNKEKAKLQYKADLAEWNAKMLLATADAARLILNGFLTTPFIPAGLAAGSLAALTGGAQLIAIGAAKPVAPAMSTGGIVIPGDGGVLTRQAENGYPELDLNGGPSGEAFLALFADKVAARIGNGGEPIIIPISLSFDGKEVANVTARYFNNGQVVLKK